MHASASNTPTYQEALSELLLSIRETSEAAAACIGQIQQQYGAKSAYLAAYAILVLKLQQDEQGRIPRLQDLTTYTFHDELKDDAHAMALYTQAAIAFLPALGTSA
jgi:hypothetical protein